MESGSPLPYSQNLPILPVLSWSNQSSDFQLYFLKNHFNIILPSKPDTSWKNKLKCTLALQVIVYLFSSRDL